MLEAKELKVQFQKHLDSIRLMDGQDHSLYEPMWYILSLKAKRIRPLLTLLAFQAVKGTSPGSAMNIATAVEMFHNFSLIHDDIMDNAPVRRGEPTVHVKWDRDIAILSGDVLVTMAYQFLVKGMEEKAGVLVPVFSELSAAVCEGQMEDMLLARQDQVSIEDYIQMISKKTAALIGGSLKLGAIAAGASPEIVQKCFRFGEVAGIGFQLQDDFMDVFAPEGFGKQIGGDILENKKTFLLLKAMELANPIQQEKMKTLLTIEENPERKVSGVIQLYDELGIREQTQKMIESYFDEARILGKELDALAAFGPLKSFLEQITKRQF